MTEVLTCAGCGDEVSSLDQESSRGPCCHALPRPWVRSPEGLYNSTSEHSSYEGDEEEDEVRPHCTHCGSAEFLVTGSLEVETGYEDGEFIYYDSSNFNLDVSCRACGTAPGHLYLEHI